MEPENAKIDASTNTNPLSQIALINKETKKKPYDVKIKNYNPNEPKIQANMKYSDKQKFRRYKTKTEPKLFSKIMIDEEDDIVKTIKKAFGIEDKKKLNYSEVETSGTPYYETPIQQAPEIVNQEQPQIRERPQMIERPQMQERRIRQPSASTEITSDIAQPPPMSPGQIRAQMVLKQSEENRKKREIVQAEAIKRAEQEREKILELSRITNEEQKKEKEEQAKMKPGDTVAKIREIMRQRDKREQDILAKDPKSRTREEREILQSIKETKKAEALMKKEYEKRLTEFVGLTDKERKVLDKEFEISGSPPSFDTYGRTPEERAGMMFWIFNLQE